MQLSERDLFTSARQLLCVLFFSAAALLERATDEDFFSFVPGHTWLCYHVIPLFMKYA